MSYKELNTICVYGAGGSIGHRITSRLVEASYDVRAVEIGAKGQEILKGLNIVPAHESDALADADAVILAVPDNIVGKVAHEIEPQLKSAALVIILDAAAPYAGALPVNRDDIGYFVTHPCHPQIFGDFAEDSQRKDHFGGVAPQSIVSCLFRGTEEDFRAGEELAKVFFGPVTKSHRVTIEQFALLEPGLVEMITLTLIDTIHRAMDECIARGVPEEVARDFLLGHLNVELAMWFGFAPKAPSAAALQLVEWTKPKLVCADWTDLLDEHNLKEAVRIIASSGRHS